jgi:hypothetical protein
LFCLVWFGWLFVCFLCVCVCKCKSRLLASISPCGTYCSMRCTSGVYGCCLQLVANHHLNCHKGSDHRKRTSQFHVGFSIKLNQVVFGLALLGHVFGDSASQWTTQLLLLHIAQGVGWVVWAKNVHMKLRTQLMLRWTFGFGFGHIWCKMMWKRPCLS